MVFPLCRWSDAYGHCPGAKLCLQPSVNRSGVTTHEICLIRGSEEQQLAPSSQEKQNASSMMMVEKLCFSSVGNPAVSERSVALRPNLAIGLPLSGGDHPIPLAKVCVRNDGCQPLVGQLGELF